MMLANLNVSQASELPADLKLLVLVSLAEGFRFLQRLRDEWNSGANRFAKPGETFLVARCQGYLAGVCGLNVDPYASDPTVGRLRHLYVSHRYRRQGVARALVLEALSCARQHFALVRVRTDTRAGALFYRALGFSPVAFPHDATHELRLPETPAA